MSDLRSSIQIQNYSKELQDTPFTIRFDGRVTLSQIADAMHQTKVLQRRSVSRNTIAFRNLEDRGGDRVLVDDLIEEVVSRFGESEREWATERANRDVDELVADGIAYAYTSEHGREVVLRPDWRILTSTDLEVCPIPPRAE